MQGNIYKTVTGSVVVKALLIILSSTTLLLQGCDQETEGKKDGSESKDGSKGKSGKLLSSGKAEDKLSRKIEALTGNHSRLVWSRYVGESADSFVNGNQHQLWGIDTRDGLGVRVILKDKTNYSRPLISPDGKWIVYTNKHTERKGKKKSFKPVIHRVNWQGEQDKELGKGFAVDVWQDPATKKVWVYTVNLIPTDRSSMFADKLERFPVDAPEKRELVWKKTKISIDNIQLSLDGKRASCLFPWPDVGVIDLEKKEYWKNQHGCWPAMAPDNSYVAWVFDGSHKSVHLFADHGKKLSVVPINKGPGMEGKEMYHPRWSNDARFMTLTGPYKGATIGKSGKHAEVYIGKFDQQMKSVEGWVRVTDDKKADHFPDLWIKGGEATSLGKIAAAGAAVTKPAAEKTGSWPSQPGGLIYVWQNAAGQNQIGAGAAKRVCKLEARQRARFGRHFGMLTGGGFFEVDSASAKVVADQAGKGNFAFQLRLSSGIEGQQGVILSAGDFQLAQEKTGELTLLTKQGKFPLGKVKAGEVTLLAASLQGGKWTLYRDGKLVEAKLVKEGGDKKTVPSGAVIGDGKWDGEVEGLAIYNRALSPKEVSKDFAYWQAKAKARKPARRVKLRAKLVEMTEVRSVEELDTYRRALLAYTYEVEEVIDGKYDQPKVIVNHWSILDRKALSTIPRKLGQTYTLEIEPLKQHPELTSERRWNDSFDVLDEYFDVTTPES